MRIFARIAAVLLFLFLLTSMPAFSQEGGPDHPQDEKSRDKDAKSKDNAGRQDENRRDESRRTEQQQDNVNIPTPPVRKNNLSRKIEVTNTPVVRTSRLGPKAMLDQKTAATIAGPKSTRDARFRASADSAFQKKSFAPASDVNIAFTWNAPVS